MRFLEKFLKPVPAKLPDKGGSFLPSQDLKNTATYPYHVRTICIETLSKGDFSKVKDASVAVDGTNNALSQEAVFDALHKSINKEHVIKEITTVCAFRELLSELEKVKSTDKIWMVSSVKRQPSFELGSGNQHLELESGEDSSLGDLIRPEELQMILGGKIDNNTLIDILNRNNGIIELKGIVLKDPIEVTKLEEPVVEETLEISPFLTAPAKWNNN